jgi:hypothetical protein
MNIRVSNRAVFVNGKRIPRIYGFSSRKIFIGEGVVVKLDGDDGFSCDRQCAREMSKWKSMCKEDRKYFVKPIASGRGWIAQKKIKFRKGRRP